MSSRPDHRTGHRRLAALLLIGALALTGCRSVVGRSVDGGALPDAEAEARDEAERSGWRDLTVLETRRAPGFSYAFYAYRSEDDLGPNGQRVVVECYGFTLRQADGPDGSTGGGGGTCIPASEPVPEGDYSWSSEDPLRLLGSVPVEATAAEVVYADGEVERVAIRRAGPSWGRAFVSAVLSRPVADVVEFRAILDDEG